MSPSKVPAELSAMTGKWSTKPSDHEANRVRNNQRRHRARVKSHIADLEKKLGESEQRLSHAEARIAQLTAELDSFRNGQPPHPTCEGPSPELSNGGLIASPAGEGTDSTMEEPAVGPDIEMSSCASGSKPVSAELEATVDADTNQADDASPLISGSREPMPLPAQSTASIETDESKSRHPLCCSSSRREPTQRLTQGLKDALEKGLLSLPSSSLKKKEMVDQPYSDLDPERPDESTTLCSNAFTLIEQQNVRGLDLSAIAEWLQEGFRRIESGNGDCAVENRVLFALLDYISSS